MDPIGRAKYDAWARLRSMSASDAMGAYVTLVETLKSK
jgi:acyl-CoA-binding protein